MNDNAVQKASMFGAVGAAFAASICCVGPLVLALLGLGGAGLLVKLEPDRPLMTAVTLGFLGVGFWLPYMRPKVPAPTGDDCGCEKPKVNRAGRIGLWLVTALVVGLLLFPYITPDAPAPVATPSGPTAAMSTATLHVEGMTCSSCALAIRTALGKLDGVGATVVDIDGKKATVTYDPARVTPAAIAQKVNDLGYTATLGG